MNASKHCVATGLLIAAPSAFAQAGLPDLKVPDGLAGDANHRRRRNHL